MRELMNVQIETKDGVNVVSSRVIAEQLGKEHKHVLETIRKIGHNLDPSYFIESSYKDKYDRDKKEYLLTKDGFTLYMFNIQGYNDFKMAYINAFNKMEQALKSQFQVPTTFAEALRLAADQQEQIEQQKKLIEVQKPKADYYDGLVERGNNLNFRDTAKLLGIGEKAFIFMLIDKKYIYRDAKGKLKPIAQYAGKYFELKEWTTNDKSGTQTLITVKGRERFAELIKELKEGDE